jgi:hypothetical protein
VWWTSKVDYYIPAKPTPQAEDFAALQEAGWKIAALLAAGVDAAALVADFQEARTRDADL